MEIAMFPMGRTFIRRAVVAAPALALFLLCTSCNGFWVSQNAVASLAVSPGAILLAAAPSATTSGDTYDLVATAVTEGGTSETVTSTATWKTSAAAVATVSAGVVTAETTSGAQTATISVTDGGYTVSTSVYTYTGTAPTTMSINVPGNITPTAVPTATSFQLTATADINGNTTENITNYVVWTSSSTSLATVNSTGEVTTLSTAGSFTITATAYLGSSAPSSTITGTSTSFTIE
jgi:hypothetical protein